MTTATATATSITTATTATGNASTTTAIAAAAAATRSARRSTRRPHAPSGARHDAAPLRSAHGPGPVGPMRVPPGSPPRRHLALVPAPSSGHAERSRPPRPAAATQSPNYLLRRVAVAAGALVLLIALVAAALAVTVPAGFGGAPAVASGASPAASASPASHVARPGDTLWSIAAEHRGAVDHRDYVDALVALNGTSIQAGQLVRLP